MVGDGFEEAKDAGVGLGRCVCCFAMLKRRGRRLGCACYRVES